MKITKKQERENEINNSKEYLRKVIDKEKGIYILITSVSRSGMSRKMRVYNDKMQNISFDVANAIDWGLKDYDVLVAGCGMDMTFHLAYTLTNCLYTEKERETVRGNRSGTLPWKVL